MLGQKGSTEDGAGWQARLVAVGAKTGIYDIYVICLRDCAYRNGEPKAKHNLSLGAWATG